jgi:hypothetical protein
VIVFASGGCVWFDSGRRGSGNLNGMDVPAAGEPIFIFASQYRA